MNISLLAEAQQDWENFTSMLSDEDRNGLSEIVEPVSSNSLHYFAVNDEAVKFDTAVQQLSKKYLYDVEIVPTVYNYYVQRDLHEVAFDYIQSAQEYFNKNKTAIPPDIEQILAASESILLLNKYKVSLDRIRSLSPKNIPSITPETINDKRQLNKFILNEIVQVIRVVREKKEALRQVTHENRFNDFIQAILRLRFPVWGWSIPDQARVGTSSGGADAGSADLLIQSGGGNNIALIEALILRDKAYTQEHILKCPKYIGTINKYYVIVYCFGAQANFENNWTTYKDDVLSTAYPAAFSIDATIGFIDLLAEFDDVNNFKIARTLHGADNEMFHVMINLGPRV